MVTQNIHYLESHLALPSEPPPIMQSEDNHQSRTLSRVRISPEKKILHREDPMSHRIIEKRRRDRMNNCLADLSRLIPAEYLKKGRGRIEKTEIIEMAIKHMKHLHSVVCSRSPTANSTNELPENSHSLDNCDLESKESSKEEFTEHTPGKPTELYHATKPETESDAPPINLEHFKLGYQECLSESMHYLVEVKGYYPGSSLCMQLICHLQKHCDKLLKGDRLNKPRAGDSTSTSNSPSSSSKPHGSGSSSGDSCERLQMPKQEPVESGYDSSSHLISQRYDQAMPQSIEYAPASPQELPVRRDNLTLPNLSLFNIEQEQSGPASNQMMMRHSHESYPTETSPCPSLSADNSLYKFKNNIKQRFTAEHATPHGSSSGYLSAPPTKKSRSSETTAKYDESPSNDSQCYESNSELRGTCDAASRGVAIFALHGDGTFYIPLTVDYSSLLPYLGACSLRRTSRNPPLVLHPVTLSVCFQHNGSGFTRHTTNTGTSGTSSEFGASSLVKLQK